MQDNGVEKTTPPPPAPQADLCLEVAEGGLEARISGQGDPDWDAAEAQRNVVDLIKENGVRYGVDTQAVRVAVERLVAGQGLEDHVVARGARPQPGRDAELEMLVKVDQEKVGRRLDTGHIDFRDKGPLPVVEAGTPLARLHLGQPGQDGKDVRGARLPCPPGRMIRLKGGKGVSLEQDNTVVVATTNGMVVHPEEDRFEVLGSLEVEGDVDYDTGHVDFPGLVKVSGAVLSGFRVNCYRLEVGELEPGAEVQTREDLVVSSGVMGSKVSVEGNLTARFVRDTDIDCQGDVVVDSEIVNSRVNARGKVVVSSGDGRIINSAITAVQGVAVSQIISSGSGGTVIHLGVDEAFEKEYHHLKRERESLERLVRDLEEATEAQREELAATEEDLRGMLMALKDPAQEASRDTFLGQVEMLKPLRANLKEGLAAGMEKLEEALYEVQKGGERLAELEEMMPGATVWLDVRRTADPTTEIHGPRAKLTLSHTERGFSAREVEMKDPQANRKMPRIEVIPLRAKAL